MARAASLADACSYAGVVAASISATSTPTTTQATAAWDDAFGAADSALAAAGLSTTQTAGTVAYKRALEIERLLTSAKVLRIRQPIGPDVGPHPAAEYEERAEAIAAELIRIAAQLVGAGQATPQTTAAGRGWSYMVDGQAPGTDLTPGTGAVPYATPSPPRGGGRW